MLSINSYRFTKMLANYILPLGSCNSCKITQPLSDRTRTQSHIHADADINLDHSAILGKKRCV